MFLKSTKIFKQNNLKSNMDEKGSAKKILIWILAIIAIIVVALVVYSVANDPTRNALDLHCQIQPAFATMNLHVGNVAVLQIVDYQGSLDKVYWTTEDSSIAVVNPQSGEGASVEAKKVGTTNIFATDTSVSSDCKTSIKIVVEE